MISPMKHVDFNRRRDNVLEILGGERLQQKRKGKNGLFQKLWHNSLLLRVVLWHTTCKNSFMELFMQARVERTCWTLKSVQYMELVDWTMDMELVSFPNSLPLAQVHKPLVKTCWTGKWCLEWRNHKVWKTKYHLFYITWSSWLGGAVKFVNSFIEVFSLIFTQTAWKHMSVY